jgi:mRNA interferase HigB
VRIVARKTLTEYYRTHPDAEQQLEAWFYEAKHANWKTPAAIKQRYANASILSDNRVVFNIKGNDYRLVVKIHYITGIIYIRFFGTHAEYDKIDAEKI